MLTKADDYPIHQTSRPIAYTGSDRNFYDRYFFNGYSRGAETYFALAFGVYPNLDVMDKAVDICPVGAILRKRVGFQVPVGKRAYEIYEAESSEAVLLVAALRGTYHMTELAGAELIMSIHPRYQAILLEPGIPREQRIDLPVEPQAIERLQNMPEFVRAYELNGMKPHEFIAFGATQRTLSQFDQVGWAMLEAFDAF